MKHMPKNLLAVIKNSVLFLTVFLYEKEPFTCNFYTRHNTKYNMHHLVPIKY